MRSTTFILVVFVLFTAVNLCLAQEAKFESRAPKEDYAEIRSLLLRFERAFNNKDIESVLDCLSKTTLNYASSKEPFIKPFLDYKDFCFIFELDNFELSQSFFLNRYNLNCLIKVKIEYLLYSGELLSFLSNVKFEFNRVDKIWKIQSMNYFPPDLDKKPFEFYIYQACMNFQDKKYNAMEEYLNKAIELNPASSLTNFLLGLGIYYAQSDSYKSLRATRYFQKARELLSENPETFHLGDSYYRAALYYYLALNYYHRKIVTQEQITEDFYQTLIKEVKDILGLNPNHAMALHFLTDLYFLRNEINKAREARYEVFKNMRGSSSIFHVFYIYDLSKYKDLDLSNEFLRLPDYSQESIDKFKKIIEKDIEFTPAYYYLGKVYFMKEDFVEAQRYLKEVIKRDPSNDDAFFMLAAIYQRDKKIDLAIEYYNNGFRLNPYSVTLYLYLAYLYNIKNNPSEAMVYAKKFIEFHPYDYRGLFMLSDIYLNQIDDKYNEGLQVTKEALKLCTRQEDMLSLSYRINYLLNKITSK